MARQRRYLRIRHEEADPASCKSRWEIGARFELGFAEDVSVGPRLSDVIFQPIHAQSCPNATYKLRWDLLALCVVVAVSPGGQVEGWREVAASVPMANANTCFQASFIVLHTAVG